MSKQIEYIAADCIEQNKLNTRSMEEEQIEVLADSIKDVGLINPLVVYQNRGGTFTIVDGHRRYSALKKIGRVGANKIPCIVLEKPSDEIREQELMANGNITRRKPEDLNSEIEIANILWNTMPSSRREKLTQEYKGKFINRFSNDEKYKQDPSQFLSNRFRPRIDYIRSITGLDYSNKTVTSKLSEVICSKNEKLNPKVEKEIKIKIVSSKEIIHYIKSLKGMLMTYKNLETVPATKQKILSVIDELSELEVSL